MDNKCIKTLKDLLEKIIVRIHFFLPKINTITANSDEMEYYDWFFIRNLVDFEKIAEILNIKHKTKTDWNINNPFSIWAEYFDNLKHQDKANRMLFNFKDKYSIAMKEAKQNGIALFNFNELFFDNCQDSYKYQDNKQQLIDCFVTPLLLNNNLVNIIEEIDIVYNKWNDILKFLEFFI